MGWRLGEIRPVNKSAGARPIVDERNSVVALALLGSPVNDRNIETILRARAVEAACLRAIRSLGESHPVAEDLRAAIGGLNFSGKTPDTQTA